MSSTGATGGAGLPAAVAILVVLTTFQLDDAFDLHQLASETVAELVTAGLPGWAVWRWFHARNGDSTTTRSGDTASIAALQAAQEPSRDSPWV